MYGKRSRVTCLRRYPTNELFKFWISDLKDKAAANGSKLSYVYGCSLKSLERCPLELKTADDAKMLDNIGEKIVKILSVKLKQFVEKYGEPTFENIVLAGVNIEEEEDDFYPGDDRDPKKTKKKSAKRPRSNRRDYIPAHRSGGYAILRALYDAYLEEGDGEDPTSAPYVAKRELQTRAQQYCDESLTTATRDKPYTAWSSMATLQKHDLVRMSRTCGPYAQYTLTEAGLAMGKRLAEAAEERRSPSPAMLSTSDLSLEEEYEHVHSQECIDPPPEPYYGELGHAPAGEEFMDEPTPHAVDEGISTVQVGYVYVNSDGVESQDQDNAHVMIDEAMGNLWYLVKTSCTYLQEASNLQWRECIDLPPSAATCHLDIGQVLMFLGSESADQFAPGIFESVEGVTNRQTEAIAPVIRKSKDLERNFEFTSMVEKPVIEKSATGFTTLDPDTIPSTSRGPSQVTDPPKKAPTSPKKTVSSPKKAVASPKKTVPSPKKAGSSSQVSSSSKSSPASRELIVLEPFTFEIDLIVDHGETCGGVAMSGEKEKNRKSFLVEGLDELKVNYVQRKLAVGDYLFVAREKGMGTNAASGRELVLGPVIERKRMDDLAASIRDGRFHEQKQRLRNCGVQKVVYLVEDYGKSMNTFGMKEAALRSAIIGTQIFDGFDVIRKKNPQESAVYLFNLLSILRERYSSKRLISQQHDTLPLDQLLEMGVDELPLPTFQEFSDLSIKRRPLTVGGAFARCLMQFSGVSSERADAIVRIYPTISHLLEAYEGCGGDEEMENDLLAAIPCGQLGRNLGGELSKKIAAFFCAREPFTQ